MYKNNEQIFYTPKDFMILYETYIFGKNENRDQQPVDYMDVVN